MKNIPKISIVMSVYNGERYVGEALDSICAQTFRDWELIIINDCSTDGTAEILKKYAAADNRIRIFENEVNLKLPSSLNKAVALSEGTYIARMDADDIALPERLEKQLDFMEKHLDVMISSCRYMSLKGTAVSSGGGGVRCDFEAIKALLLVTNPILHPGVIAKTAVMKKLLYDKALTCTEDLDVWVRAAKNGIKMQIQNEYLMLYRIHEKQITGTTLDRQKKEVLSIQKRHNPVIFDNLSEEMLEFYISGIYFKENMDAEAFRTFRKKVRELNKKAKICKKSAVDYAFFEILAEYKRCGFSKCKVLKCLWQFNPIFLTKEYIRRKNAVRRDGKNCIAAAKKVGLMYKGNGCEFPAFSDFNGVI